VAADHFHHGGFYQLGTDYFDSSVMVAYLEEFQGCQHPQLFIACRTC